MYWFIYVIIINQKITEKKNWKIILKEIIKIIIQTFLNVIRIVFQV